MVPAVFQLPEAMVRPVPVAGVRLMVGTIVLFIATPYVMVSRRLEPAEASVMALILGVTDVMAGLRVLRAKAAFLVKATCRLPLGFCAPLTVTAMLGTFTRLLTTL